MNGEEIWFGICGSGFKIISNIYANETTFSSSSEGEDWVDWVEYWHFKEFMQIKLIYNEDLSRHHKYEWNGKWYPLIKHILPNERHLRVHYLRLSFID